MAKGRQTHRPGPKRKKVAPPAVATNVASETPTTPRRAATVAPARPSAASARASAAPAKVDFATEYHYVLGDLKRIGILAAASFTVLVVLALIIR